MKTKQISKTKEPSKWHILFIGIGALVLTIPVYFVMCVKDFFKNKKRNKRTLSNIKLGEKYGNAPLMPYKEPISPVDDGNSFPELMSLSVFNLKDLTDSAEEGTIISSSQAIHPNLKNMYCILLRSIQLRICFAEMLIVMAMIWIIGRYA